MIPSQIPNKNWTLFLDRDGVINERKVGGYILHRSEFILKENVIEAMQLLRKQFGRIIVVSNQQCIAKGLCTSEDIDDIHNYMRHILLEFDLFIDGIYVCPHRAEEQCHCRKPQIGLAEEAKAQFSEINFSQSIMVGDMLTDLQFGRNSGMHTAYVGEVEVPNFDQIIDHSDWVCYDLYDFAKWIQ